MAAVVINSDDTRILRDCLLADTKVSVPDRQRLINKLDRLEEKMVRFTINKAIKIE